MKRVNYPVLLALLPLALETAAYADEAQQPATQPPQSPVARVTVTGIREPEDHYRVPAVDSIGPLGTTPVLDTPYSIGILPRDLIENSQAVNFKDVSKYLPLVAYQEQQGPDILRPQTRGMQGGNFQNTRLDGMTMFITVANAMEQFNTVKAMPNQTQAFLPPDEKKRWQERSIAMIDEWVKATPDGATVLAAYRKGIADIRAGM